MTLPATGDQFKMTNVHGDVYIIEVTECDEHYTNYKIIEEVSVKPEAPKTFGGGIATRFWAKPYGMVLEAVA